MDIEDASTHKDDTWAIFTAPKGKEWNLSKVVVNIPNANKGTNENDKDGYVNNEISIAVGNDLTSMTKVKTFSNLEEVSELEYIFPEYKSSKYLAIICNLNAYFYPSLAEVEAYEQFEEAIPSVAPVSVTGWNADVIAEAKPASTHTTGTLDNQGWALYSSDVQAAGSLAGSDRIVTTANGTKFELADYTANNALVMKSAYKPSTLTLTTPQNCDELYFLMISANGQSSVSAYATYTDGTTSNTGAFRPSDWFSGTPDGNEAVYGISRIITKSVDSYLADDIDSRDNFRLYEFTLPTDKSKKVESITFQNNSYGKYPTILGVSKKGYKVATGIENVENRPNVQTVTGIYTINGMKVNHLQKGINIIKMADGTTRKVVVK